MATGDFFVEKNYNVNIRSLIRQICSEYIFIKEICECTHQQTKPRIHASEVLLHPICFYT